MRDALLEAMSYSNGIRAGNAEQEGLQVLPEGCQPQSQGQRRRRNSVCLSSGGETRASLPWELVKLVLSCQKESFSLSSQKGIGSFIYVYV